MIKVTIDRATSQSVAQLIAERFEPKQTILFDGNAGYHSELHSSIVPEPHKAPRAVLGVFSTSFGYDAVVVAGVHVLVGGLRPTDWDQNPSPRPHPASVISNVGALSKYHEVSAVLASSRLSEVP